MGLSPTQATHLVDKRAAGGFLRPLRHRKQEPATGDEFHPRRPLAAGQRVGVQVAESKVRAEDVAELVALVEGKIATRRSQVAARAACGLARFSQGIVEREAWRRRAIPRGRALRRRGVGRESKRRRRLSRGKDQRRGLLGRPDHEGVARKSGPSSSTGCCAKSSLRLTNDWPLRQIHDRSGPTRRRPHARGPRLRGNPRSGRRRDAHAARRSRLRAAPFRILRSGARASRDARRSRSRHGCRFYVMPAMDTAELLRPRRSAACSGTLECGPSETPSRRLRRARSRAARPGATRSRRSRTYAALNSLQRTVTDAIDERGNVLDRASPALGRIARLAQAQPTRAIAWGPSFAPLNMPKAIQDPCDGSRRPFRRSDQGRIFGRVPGIVHDTSSSGRRCSSSRWPRSRRTTGFAPCDRRGSARSNACCGVVATRRRARARSRSRGRAREPRPPVRQVAGRARDGRVAPSCARSRLVDRAAAIRCWPMRRSADDRAGRIRAPHGHQRADMAADGQLQDGRTLRCNGVRGYAIPAAMGSRIGRFETCRRHRRRAVDRAQRLNVLGASRAYGEILSLASDRLLYLVRRNRRGTEQFRAALAIAALERLMSAGAFGIVTTHATNSNFSRTRGGVKNASGASIRHVPATFQLDVGTPGQSLAFPWPARSASRTRCRRAERLLGIRASWSTTGVTELALRASEMQRERDGLFGRRR